MTYSSFESSEYLAQPIEIYEFVRGIITWRFTTADEDKIVNSQTYTKIIAERSSLEQTQEMSRNPINIKMDKNVNFLQQFRTSPPSDPINLIIKRFHEGDNEVVTIWIGRLINVQFKEREAELRCEPIFTSLKRPVLRRRYQTTCPHVLYGPQCGKSAALSKIAGSVNSILGNKINVNSVGSYSDGFFSGGFVDWQVNGVVERRFIINHIGVELTLNLPFGNMGVGSNIYVYPGCDHTLQVCEDKHANSDNYGGQPFYPSKNPLTGSLIF